MELRGRERERGKERQRREGSRELGREAEAKLPLQEKDK